MNRAETINLIKKVKSIWSSYRPTDDLNLLVETWQEWLGSYDYQEVSAVLLQFRGEFAPSLPSIVQAMERRDHPNDMDALSQARRWINYADQMRYFNGSGYKPVKPDDIHPEVQRVAGIVGTAEGWETRFRFAWKDR